MLGQIRTSGVDAAALLLRGLGLGHASSGLARPGLKSLSALCGTLTIPVAYATADKLLANRRSALIVAALTACNPFLIWYSQEARAYSMLVLFSACTLLAFAYARQRPRALPLTLWALASALALLTHYYAVII